MKVTIKTSVAFCLLACSSLSFAEIQQNYSSYRPSYLPDSSWYIGIGGGDSRINLPGTTYVANGAPSPNNHDRFTIDSPSAKVMQYFAGYRWNQERKYFPYAHLYFQYRHFLNTDIKGNIDQYSLPGFKNYTYRLNYESDLFTMTGKFNVLEVKGLMPYFSVGGGGIINHLNGYSESPYPGVTPRTSPNYNGNSSTKLAMTLGLGFDFIVTKNVWLTLGVDRVYQGDIKSGGGTASWANTNINIGNVKMDTVFLNITADIPGAIKNQG